MLKEAFHKWQWTYERDHPSMVWLRADMADKDKFIILSTLVRPAVMYIQWNPSITDTIGDQHFVPYSEVSLTQALSVYFW